jgi:lysophospholipid acyltransferase (LPLAT)-like uncharacterized protein
MWRKLRRRLRSALVRPLLWLALHTLPALYVAYMRFVWATSRVSDHGLLELHEISRRHNGAVALLWHEEVFSVAFAYPYIGLRGHTLASISDVGHLITKALERCGYVVFRGGSSRKKARRRGEILFDMIEHMRTHDRVIYGLTVDGSTGPAYRIKPGGIVIARACDKPIVLARTWYKRAIRLATWDRTAIPLPFNVITPVSGSEGQRCAGDARALPPLAGGRPHRPRRSLLCGDGPSAARGAALRGFRRGRRAAGRTACHGRGARGVRHGDPAPSRARRGPSAAPRRLASRISRVDHRPACFLTRRYDW